MSRLLDHFENLKERGRTALSPYLMSGFPDLDSSFDLLKTAAESGADLIEFGMPFSDPLADGPTIQKAGQIALRKPFTLEELLERFGEAGTEISAPVVVMSYYNPIYQLGLEKAAKLAAETGIAGFIVPDLPTEESKPFSQNCKEAGIDLVPLIAPTTGPDRVKRIDSESTGILYYVSRMGITGARNSLPEGIVESLERHRELTTHPSVIGFGISRPEQAALLRNHSDGIVIGSALIDEIERASNGTRNQSVREFLKPISDVLG